MLATLLSASDVSAAMTPRSFVGDISCCCISHSWNRITTSRHISCSFIMFHSYWGFSNTLLKVCWIYHKWLSFMTMNQPFHHHDPKTCFFPWHLLRHEVFHLKNHRSQRERAQLHPRQAVSDRLAETQADGGPHPMAGFQQEEQGMTCKKKRINVGDEMMFGWFFGCFGWFLLGETCS